jgi:hypothetical protein
MAKLSKKPVDLDLDSVSALEGVIVPNFDEIFESVRITSAQLGGFAKAAANLANSYSSFAIGLQGAMQEFAKSQQRIAEAMAELSSHAALNQLEIIIRTFHVPDFPIPNFPVPKLQPIQIYVQPAPAYVPPKALPAPKRKHNLELTAINIEENGFVINDEYIHGMTRDSKPGRLFELFIQKDVAGEITDKLINEVLDIEVGDYRAMGFVLRDLKDILAGNKLKLNLERYRAIGKYRLKAITQYIRKPRKKKKIAKTMQLN